MAYYPKSQIKSNLYTNGNEYIFPDTEEEYIGYYYEVSTGDTFTGKHPDDGPNERIIFDDHAIMDVGTSVTLDGNEDSGIIYPPEIPNNVIQNFGHGYYPGSPPFKLRSLPSPVLTIPTQKDYNLGEFQRYFAKKTNQNIYLEINKETHDQLKNQDPKIAFDLYTPINLPWDLSGERDQTYLTNKNIVTLIEERNKWYGFTQWFKDNFLKYYKNLSIEEDLSTDGTEFINRRTKLAYRGLYHIHPEKGPMVGAKHIQRKHDYLDPIQSSPDLIVDPIPLPTPTYSGGGGGSTSGGGSSTSGGGGGYSGGGGGGY